MLNQLKARKEKLMEERKEVIKKQRKESELNTVRSQIKGLETRLKYSQNDLETTVSLIHWFLDLDLHVVTYIYICMNFTWLF